VYYGRFGRTGRAPGRRPNQNLKSAQSPTPAGGSLPRRCSVGWAWPEGGAHDLWTRLGFTARLAAGAVGSPGNGAIGGAPRSLVLQATGLAAVLIALAEPRVTVHETKVAAAILIDTSASVTPQDLARASDLATQIEAARGPPLDSHHPVCTLGAQLPLPRSGGSRGA